MEKNSPILITGSGGFVGKNLVATLRTAGYTDLMLFEKDDTPETLADYCRRAAFVVHLAGINRPTDPSEFYTGNAGLTDTLLANLEAAGNTAPVLVTSSTQAELDNDYGKSKRQAEEAIFAHRRRTGAMVYVFRMPGVFGKWCRPNYNSAVATFSNNIANGLPIQVNDRSTELELLYIDDLVEEMLLALNGKEHRDEKGYCYCPVTFKKTLGEIVDLLYSFKESRSDLSVPDMSDGFTKRLYANYLSYLPADGFSYKLKMNRDDRGNFTEILRTADRGQVSVNISRPGITKGQHWHHTKNEKFVVVSGRGLIQLRKIGVDENGTPYPVADYEVSGEEITVVEMIPGYTHNIINLSDTEDLVTLMWANEPFDPEHPDTFAEPV